MTKAIQTLLLFACFCFNHQQLASQNSLDQDKLDLLMHTLEENNKFVGASITVTQDGKPLYNKAFGTAHLGNDGNFPANPQTIYRIGSISKTFTATMALQLIEEGALMLETPLSEFFPTVKNAGKITMKQLLNHTSGIHNFTSDPTFRSWMTQPKSHKEIIEMIASYEADFEPGEKYAYSNSNYVLLGYIIEQITKQSYAEALQSRIAKSTGLKNTFLGGKIQAEKNQASSYYFNGIWLPSPESDMSIPHGAGAVVSTTSDLCKFVEALLSQKLTSAESLHTMTALEKSHYGLGIFKQNFGKQTGLGHNGRIDGFQSNLMYFKKDKISIALISNGITYSINNLMTGIVKIVFGEVYEIPSFIAIKIPESELTKYEGVYSSKKMPLKITIKQSAGSLTAQATGQSAFPLVATSKTSFKFDTAKIQIDFSNEIEGKYTEFILRQRGAKYLFSLED